MAARTRVSNSGHGHGGPTAQGFAAHGVIAHRCTDRDGRSAWGGARTRQAQRPSGPLSRGGRKGRVRKDPALSFAALGWGAEFSSKAQGIGASPVISADAQPAAFAELSPAGASAQLRSWGVTGAGKTSRAPFEGPAFPYSMAAARGAPPRCCGVGSRNSSRNDSANTATQ